MSTKPTSEAIRSLESEVSKGTELEARTTRYVKEWKQRRKDERDKATDEVSKDYNNGHFILSQELILNIGKQ